MIILKKEKSSPPPRLYMGNTIQIVNNISITSDRRTGVVRVSFAYSNSSWRNLVLDEFMSLLDGEKSRQTRPYTGGG